MNQTIMRIGRVVLGVLCMVIGVAGLFLPFVQGILFLVIGLTLLSSESDRARRWLDWLKSYVHRKHTPTVGERGDGR